MMRHLVDTDWVISYQRGIPRVVSRLNALLPQGVGLSAVSFAELYEGIIYSTDPYAEERALRDFLNSVEIVWLDEEICRIFARERGRLRAAGTRIEDLDLLIGATALRYGLSLLTNNRRHFERMQGLHIISV